jgi:hypothetical protein
MEPSELRPGSFHGLLKRRFFNADAEALLLERLGKKELEWVMGTTKAEPDYLSAVGEKLDQWLVDELVQPCGSCESRRRPNESGFDDETRRQRMRYDQFTQMRNSFGMGLVLGAGLYREAEAANERESADGPYFIHIPIESALGLLKEERVGNYLLGMSRVKGFAGLVEGLIWEYWRSNPLGFHLAPIAHGHGFFGYGLPPISEERLVSAKRCMMLAGMISSGLPIPEEEDEATSADEPEGLLSVEEEGLSAEDVPGVDLYKLSDEALEPLIDQVHLRESIQEELRYRLRSNRLGRMLAHLKRTSKDEHEDNEHEDNGASGDE